MTPSVLFSFKGRLARGVFALSAGLTLVAFLVLNAGIESLAGPKATLVLHPFTLWILVTLCVKRLHDRNKSAWWMLLLLLPVLGPLWLGIELLFVKGTQGENHHGADPLAPADYLVVA